MYRKKKSYSLKGRVEREKEFRKNLAELKEKDPKRYSIDPNVAVNPRKEHQTTLKKSFTGQAKKDREEWLKWMVKNKKKK